ncbi:acetate--CoA ligase family protein [Nocardioides marinisabuli]|nr:acetate--CoA ligase [Nocardioides marinisabuli]
MLRTARRVAIIGASDDPAKPSGRPQRYLRRYGFDGDVYPINPRRAEVQGLRSYASLDDVPHPPDLAVVVVPAADVEDAIVACGRAGVGVAIVFAAGYAEVPDGAERQASLLRVARAHGVRVVGPNCVGVVAAPSLAASFMSGLEQDRFDLRDDGIAFVSQSGAMGAFILNLAQGEQLGLGLFVSTGNEMDVTLPEVLGELVEDASTRVVLGYVEGIRDGRAFEDALAAARRRDLPICLLKVGSSERGAAAASSHTGSLAGADVVYQGVFDRYGVHRAASVEELLDFGRVFALAPRAAGSRVSIITLSGGAGALMTDEADVVGLAVEEWDEPWQATMAAGLPAFASTANPIDATGVIAIDDTALRHAMTVALTHPGTDVVVLVLGNLDGEEERICSVVLDVAATSTKPVVVTWVGGSGLAPRLLHAGGVPTFSDPRRTMRAVGALCRQSATRAVAAPRQDRLGIDIDLPGPGPWDEHVAAGVLAGAGLPMLRGCVVTTPQEAVAAAGSMSRPVVIKLLSTQVHHKSDVGGVRAGLTSDVEIASNVVDVLEISASLGLADGRVLVQPMASPSVELLLGAHVDPVFGSVTMVGLGGIHAELIGDVRARPGPVTPAEAREMVNGLRGAALLRGARGQVAVDMPALAETVAAFSQVACSLEDRTASIEVNPLRFLADGTPIGVDALMIPIDQEDA